MNQDLKDLRDAFIWWTLSLAEALWQKSMWHAGVEGRPQGTGYGSESERELGSAGDGEVLGFHSWRSGEVRMVLSSRMMWADFSCNPLLWLLRGDQTGVAGVGRWVGGREEAGRQ